MCIMQIYKHSGLIPFQATDSIKSETWYCEYGDVRFAPALIVLNGGPGACHEYMSSLGQLTLDYGIPLVLYDQIGNGRSTRFPEENGDESF